jgi:predicted dehydrogenase
MTMRLTRRRFLHAAAATGISPFWGGLLLADDKKAGSPNERLHVGVIGVGGQGNHDWRNVHAAGAEIVAFCDVDEDRKDVQKAREEFPKVPFHADFRKLIDQKDIDAIIVGTPDHMHAFATVAALKSGRHVFCEKPLTHTVHEARVVAETAAKEKKVTQMGTQIHAGDNYRRVVELVQGGIIGAIREVHVWCGTYWGGGDRPKDTPPVPKGLHWDLWLGPAPERPYHPTYVPFYWRRWWDFGGGTLADMACHYTDLPFWALKLRHPTTIAADGPSPVHPETAPHGLIVHYEYPSRGDLPAVKLTWYDGGKQPDAVLTEHQLPRWGNGVLFMGEKGLLMADYNQHKLFPEKQFAGFTPPKPTIPNSIGHYKEWVEACKTGAQTTCNFDYAGALTEAVLLGNVSYRVGRPITWDAKNLKAVNDAEAERFVRKEYRKGWGLNG